MSTRTALWCFAAVVVFGLAPETTAELYTVPFQGVVDQITGGDDLDDSVTVGDEFTGSYTFETTTPPERTETGFARYKFTGALQRFTVTIGNYTWRSADDWTCGVHNNHAGRDGFDESSDYIVVEQTAGPPLPDMTYFALQFDLSTTRNLAALTSTAVPRVFPDPSLFETNYLSVGGGRDSHGVIRNIRGYFVAPVANDTLTLPYEDLASEAGQAFRVNNTYAGAGKSYGGWFQSAGAEGRGVYGRATSMVPDVNPYGGFFYAAGPKGRGVFGQSAGAQEGIGVKGWASNTGDVQNFGGHFCATGLRGIGVYGRAENQGDGQNYGGYFLAEGNRGTGVFAIGGPNGSAGQFERDIKITGAGNGIIFPDGSRQTTAAGSTSTSPTIGACADPAYDSGWIEMPISPLGPFSKTLTHNLGGDSDRYLVELRCRISGWGQSNLTDKGLGEDFYYRNLTASSITVVGPQSALDGSANIRARIWVYK